MPARLPFRIVRPWLGRTWHRSRIAALLLACLGAQGVLPAQESIPEEPDWDENAATTLEEDLSPESPAEAVDLTSDTTLEELPAPEPAPTPAPPVQRRSTPPRPQTPSHRPGSTTTLPPPAPFEAPGAAAAEASLEQPDLLPPSEIGIPAAQNHFLPNLNDPADPWFQWEGLRFRFGELYFRLTLQLAFEYNDNIYYTANKVADYITTIGPTLSLGIGDFDKKVENYIALAYTPQPQIFAENSDQTTINEFLNVAGQYTFSRLSTELEFDYIKDSNPVESDIGRREYNQYALTWTNSYAIGTRTFVELVLNGSYVDYNDPYVDYTTVSIQPRVAYEFSQKLRLTLGPYAGVTWVQDGGEQRYEGLLLGFQYDSFSKLSFSGAVGFQAIQYVGDNPTGAEDTVTPIVELRADYIYSEKTSFYLGLEQSFRNSGESRGQTYIYDNISLGYRQRFFQPWVFNLNFSLSFLNYQGGDERTDTYLRTTPSIGYIFWREQCTWSLFYTRTQRFSELDNYSFDQNIFGTRLTIEF